MGQMVTHNSSGISQFGSVVVNKYLPRELHHQEKIMSTLNVNENGGDELTVIFIVICYFS